MNRLGRAGLQVSLLIVAASVAGACSSNGNGGSNWGSPGSSSSGASSSGGSSSGGSSSGTSSGGSFGSSGGTFGDASTATGSSSGSNSSGCNVTNTTADNDKDGWSIAEGDCNDCDPNVNPGAIDVLVTPVDGGAPYYTDNDCDGTPGDDLICDTGLALTDTTAGDGAKSIELCRTGSPDGTAKSATGPTWGVMSASYTGASGTAFPGTGWTPQVGIQPGFGTNVHVQKGSNMLMLSSGHARTPSQTGACGSRGCAERSGDTPPSGFPQDNPSCTPDPSIFDDIQLELKLRAPTNATGYSFNFKFYSFEYPYYVCDSYNDQFIALVSPAPTGSLNGNIAFDSNHNAVSVDLGFFNVCNTSDQSAFAGACNGGGGTCPTAPSPYCPAGDGDLLGTGFDKWEPGAPLTTTTTGMGGATSWLTTQAPVTGGQEFTITFLIFDTGDQDFDSSVLIDNFHWIATPGTTVSVGTTPTPQPQ